MKQTLCADCAGERADQFLARSIEGLSRSAAVRLLEADAVTRDGVALCKKDLLCVGDTLLVCLPEPVSSRALAEDIPLDVVYEDADLIVINKPVGLVVHPAPGHPGGTLVNALLHHCGDSLSGIGGELRPGIVHRIDRDTSGLLVVAKNDAAHLSLTAQLQDHSLYRLYDAVVVGSFREDEGTINAPIGRDTRDRKRMAINREHGREAITHWKTLTRFTGFSHLQCRLETGRTHQIRVHLASVGHPVLGDPVYGSKKPYPGLRGQCLHARSLTFTHPRSGQTIEVDCPLPDYFQAILHKLNRFGGETE